MTAGNRRLVAADVGRRRPRRVDVFAVDVGGPGPLLARAADADRVAQGMAGVDDVVERPLAGAHDDGAGRIAADGDGFARRRRRAGDAGISDKDCRDCSRGRKARPNHFETPQCKIPHAHNTKNRPRDSCPGVTLCKQAHGVASAPHPRSPRSFRGARSARTRRARSAVARLVYRERLRSCRGSREGASPLAHDGRGVALSVTRSCGSGGCR